MMAFDAARCEICGTYKYDINKIFAYTVRNHEPHWVDLAGRQPWAGVRVLCADCCDFAHRWRPGRERPVPSPGVVGLLVEVVPDDR